MSSQGYKVIKGTQRTYQTNPKQNLPNTSKAIQISKVTKKIGSTRIGSRPVLQTSQPASTYVLKRELNQASSTYVRDSDQLPVQGKTYQPGRNQITQIKKNYKYDYKSKKNENLNSRTQQRDASSAGKTGKLRYKSLEEKNTFQQRYQASGSPTNRRTNPLNIIRGGTFNSKRWAYASKKEINKIIVIQRWWRYVLNSLGSKRNRFSSSTDKSSPFRSKSSKYPSVKNISFMKKGENITEKIFPGKNNNLVIETRKVEVFRSIQPKTKQEFPTKTKESNRFGEDIKISKEKISVKKEGELLTEKMYPGKRDALIQEKRKVEIFKDKRTKKVVDSQIGSRQGKGFEKIQSSKQYSETERNIEDYQNSKEFPKFQKQGENITEKRFPGKNNTLISETRKVEVFKDKGQKKLHDSKTTSKESERYAESLSKSKDKYTGEYTISKTRKEEVFTDKRQKRIKDSKPISKESERYAESLSKSRDKYTGEYTISKTRKEEVFTDKRQKRIKDSKTTSKDSERYDDSLSKTKDKYTGEYTISKTRKEEVFTDKRQKRIKDSKPTSKDDERYDDSLSKTKDKYPVLKKKGENIVNERRKVEVTKDKRIKTKSDLQEDLEETKKIKERIKETNQLSPSGTYKKFSDDKRKQKYITQDLKVSKDNYTAVGKYKENLKESKETPLFKKKGENITEKILPGKSSTLISETRKVEVFKDKRTSSKDKYIQQPKEAGKYTENINRPKEKYPENEKYFEGLKQYRAFNETIERGILKDLKRKGILIKQSKRDKKFKEENGITKKYIKEKMREIWLDESLPTAENGLIYIGSPQSKYGFRTFGTISTDTRGMSTEGYESNKIKELLNAIKEKDNELNRVVNQLKSQLDSKTKKTYTSITSPGKGKTIDSNTYHRG